MFFVETVICQVALQILNVWDRILLWTNSYIAVREYVYLERIDTSEKDPLPNIELFVSEKGGGKKQRSFYIFLDYFSLNPLWIEQNWITIIFEIYSVPSRCRTWFDYPDISIPKSFPLFPLISLEIDIFLDNSFYGQTRRGRKVFFDKIYINGRIYIRNLSWDRKSCYVESTVREADNCFQIILGCKSKSDNAHPHPTLSSFVGVANISRRLSPNSYELSNFDQKIDNFTYPCFWTVFLHKISAYFAFER